MSKPRYSLVRVDDRCPVENEEEISIVDRVKMFPCFLDKRLSCKNCRYGVTKEQLVRKVMTAFKIAIKKNKEGKFVKEKSDNRQVAEIIVEFLGVDK